MEGTVIICLLVLALSETFQKVVDASCAEEACYVSGKSLHSEQRVANCKAENHSNVTSEVQCLGLCSQSFGIGELCGGVIYDEHTGQCTICQDVCGTGHPGIFTNHMWVPQKNEGK